MVVCSKLRTKQKWLFPLEVDSNFFGKVALFCVLCVSTRPNFFFENMRRMWSEDALFGLVCLVSLLTFPFVGDSASFLCWSPGSQKPQLPGDGSHFDMRCMYWRMSSACTMLSIPAGISSTTSKPLCSLQPDVL